MPVTTPARPTEPQAWPHLFAERMNAGDLEGALDLYAADAQFVSPWSGEVLVGQAAMGGVLAGLIERDVRMQPHVVRITTAEDVALLYTDFTVATRQAAFGSDG